MRVILALVAILLLAHFAITEPIAPDDEKAPPQKKASPKKENKLRNISVSTETNREVRAILQKNPLMMKDVQEYRQFKMSIYIQTSAAKVWNALISPKMVKRYYHMPLLTLDLKKGGDAVYGYKTPEGTQPLQEGKVLEVVQNEKLALSFLFTFQKDRPNFKPELFTSRVTYELNAYGDKLCQLTLIHDDFQPTDSTFLVVSEGWPVILSKLKTLLETGKPLLWPRGGYIGFEGGELTEEQLKKITEMDNVDTALEVLGLTEAAGVYVKDVVAKSPAAKSKTPLMPGDIIVAYNGQPVANYSKFQRIHVQTKAGETVTLKVNRKGKLLALKIKLAKGPSS